MRCLTKIILYESSWVNRTARFRRYGYGSSNINKLIVGNGPEFTAGTNNKQFRRNFFTYQQQRQQQQQQESSRFMNNNSRLFSYFRSLKWNPIPISVGVGFLVFQQYRKVLRRSSDEATGGEQGQISLRQDWEITCYRMLPWKTLSKAWGWINNVNLPLWARKPVLNLYARTFNCDLDEAEVPDLTTYSNLGEFFRRSLKSGVRPIDQRSPIVSPCDGKILHFGKVDCGRIEQVKGVCYSLPAFLGPPTWLTSNKNYARQINQENSLIQFPKSSSTKNINSESYCSKLLQQKSGTGLFYCVLYLAPGDYHRFHSPVEWTVKFRRHIGGELLSVNPSIASWISGLFSLNERANYVGEWEHGYFSMTAVGATNVGSIRVYRDNALQTNSRKVKKDTYADKYFENPIRYNKGDSFGEFNLGSTIVILFEAPCDYNFKLEHQSL